MPACQWKAIQPLPGPIGSSSSDGGVTCTPAEVRPFELRYQASQNAWPVRQVASDVTGGKDAALAFACREPLCARMTGRRLMGACTPGGARCATGGGGGGGIRGN